MQILKKGNSDKVIAAKQEQAQLDVHCVLEKKEESVKIIKCYTCMDSKQVEVNRIGYDSIIGRCPNC